MKFKKFLSPIIFILSLSLSLLFLFKTSIFLNNSIVKNKIKENNKIKNIKFEGNIVNKLYLKNLKMTSNNTTIKCKTIVFQIDWKNYLLSFFNNKNYTLPLLTNLELNCQSLKTKNWKNNWINFNKLEKKDFINFFKKINLYSKINNIKIHFNNLNIIKTPITNYNINIKKYNGTKSNITFDKIDYSFYMNNHLYKKEIK